MSPDRMVLLVQKYRCFRPLLPLQKIYKHSLRRIVDAGVPIVPLLQGHQARRRAVGVGPLLSMPVSFQQRSYIVCNLNITPETATGQSSIILEIASRTSKSQQQHHDLVG